MTTGESPATDAIVWPERLRFLETTHATIEESIAFDESLLEAHDHESGRGSLWIWEQSSPAVIVGRSNVIDTEVDAAACAADGVPVLRRCSGGGAVVLGHGCLCYSLFLPITEFHRRCGISAVTADIMQRLADALSQPREPVLVRGVSDMVIDGRKFSGNSQRWRKQALLHHGTVLYDFDLDQIARYLKFPSRVPQYREDRNHLEFVRNLDMPRSEIIDRLRRAWRAD